MKISPEQQNKLSSWAEQRDAILNDISILKNEKQVLAKENIEASESLTDKETRKNEIIGEIKQLEKQEVKNIGKISKELSGLTVEKSEIQSEITKEKEILKSVIREKDSVIETIGSLLKVNDNLDGKNIELEKIAGNIEKSTNKSLSSTSKMFIELEERLKSLFEKEKQASDSANIILDKLPRWVFELQRPVSLKKITQIKKNTK